ncbi:DNA polymerase III, partial [Candidatus Pelagibacter sp.]|nr:DNA polymerase III [Candidatus Pelagibacter sp.]
MDLKSSDNLQLYGMDHFFNELVNLYNLNKMPTKILLTGKKGLGKSTMAYHIINYILSDKEEFRYDLNKFTINSNNRSFKLLKNSTNPNFHLID